MSTVWQQVEVRGIIEIPGLPGVRVEALPVFKDAARQSARTFSRG